MKTNGHKQLLGGAFFSYATIAFNIITGLLYTPWIIRTVGDDQYALYILALSVINMFMLDFGIGSAISKFLSNYYANGQYQEANRFMGIVYKVFAGITIGIAIILFVAYFWIDRIYVELTLNEIHVFKRLFIIVATYSVLAFPFMTMFNGVLMANEKFVAVKACGFGQKLLNVVLIVVALLTGMGIYALVLVNAVSNAVFVGIKYVCIRQSTKMVVDFSCWESGTAKELFDFSIWVTIGNIAGRFIFNIMPSVIAAFVGSVEVTLFSLASSLEGYVFTFSDAINGMFLPKISRILIGDKAGDELSNLMNKVGRFHVATIGLIYLVFVCVGREFITLWMGAGYELVYVCALFLIFPSLIDVPQQVARTSLLAMNIVKEQALIYIGMAGVNLLMSYMLIPVYGVVGAAISICMAYLFRTLVFNVLYYKKLPINILAYFRNTYGSWGCSAILCLIIGLKIATIEMTGWIGLAVKITLIASVYGILYAIFCMGKAEREILVKWFSHREEPDV